MPKDPSREGSVWCPFCRAAAKRQPDTPVGDSYYRCDQCGRCLDDAGNVLDPTGVAQRLCGRLSPEEEAERMMQFYSRS